MFLSKESGPDCRGSGEEWGSIQSALESSPPGEGVFLPSYKASNLESFPGLSSADVFISNDNRDSASILYFTKFEFQFPTSETYVVGWLLQNIKAKLNC